MRSNNLSASSSGELVRVFSGRAFCTLSALFLLAGCATPANHYDPLEPVNRKVYAFNSAVDKAVLKPVAQGYVAITPQPVRTGVSNFFGNLEDLYIGVSDLLEGKVKDAGSDAGRIVINSTFGLFGLLDVASSAGLQKHDADFGQVLGKWGLGSGPYLVLPLVGPKTLRDSSDLIGEFYLNPVSKVRNVDVRNSLTGLKVVDTRAKLLGAEKVVESASFGDEYSFVRDSYLQRRYSMIYDGNPPKPLKLGDDDDVSLDSLDMGTTPSGDADAKAPATADSPAAKPADSAKPAPQETKPASDQPDTPAAPAITPAQLDPKPAQPDAMPTAPSENKTDAPAAQ